MSICESSSIALRRPVLQALQDWFAERYGVATGIFDARAQPLTYETNHTDYCKCVRKLARGGGVVQCRCSVRRIIEKCRLADDVVWHVCQNGLLDLAAPIHSDIHVVAYLLAGQLRGHLGALRTEGSMRLFTEVVHRCGVPARSRHAAEERLGEAFRQVPELDPEGLVRIEIGARRFAGILSWLVTKTSEWEPRPSLFSDYIGEALKAQTVDELLELSVSFFPKIIGARHASVFLVGQDVDIGERLILRKTSVPTLKGDESIGSYARGEGLTGWVWKHGRSLRVMNGSDPAELAAIDPADPPKKSGKLKDSKKLRECLIVPITNRKGEVVGAVRAPTKPHGFTLDDEIRLSVLSEYLYSLVELSALRERVGDLRRALDVSLRMQLCCTESDVLDTLVGAVLTFFGGKQNALLLNTILEDAVSFSITTVKGQLCDVELEGQVLPLKGSTTGFVNETGKPVLIHDIAQAVKRDHYLAAVGAGQSVVAAPIFGPEGTIVAVVAIVSSKRYAFTEEDKGVLTQLCQCTTEALKRVEERNKAERYEALRLAADLLTGLRHDLGSPMEVLDVGLRRMGRKTDKLVALANFVLNGLAGYQFSCREGALSIEQALRERVALRGQVAFGVKQLVKQCVTVLDLMPDPRPACQVRCSDSFTVKGDYQLLLLVLYNLIKNARKHSTRESRDGSRIVISAGRSEESVSIQVTDANPEPPEDTLQSLFDFSTGAGLALARLFVEAHPGPSKEGRGVLSYTRCRGRNVFELAITG